MSGPLVAALALSLAVALRSPAHRRLVAGRQRRAATTAPLRWGLGCAAAAGAVAAAGLSPAVVLAAAVLGTTAAVRGRGRRRGRRGRDESRALEAALDILVGELRVGAHPVRAFSVAAAETGEAVVAAALRAVAARARLGADVPAGLRSVGADSAFDGHWERLAVWWQLADDHGLAISTLMRTAQRDIAERQRFSDRVAAGMAGARATALILSGLPVLGVALGQLIGAAPLGFLFGTPAGGWVLVVGVALTCGGLLWADRIAGMAHR